MAHFARGGHIPLMPRRGPLVVARRSRPDRVSAAPARDAGHHTESAAASEAVDRTAAERTG